MDFRYDRHVKRRLGPRGALGLVVGSTLLLSASCGSFGGTEAASPDAATDADGASANDSGASNDGAATCSAAGLPAVCPGNAGGCEGFESDPPFTSWTAHGGASSSVVAVAPPECSGSAREKRVVRARVEGGDGGTSTAYVQHKFPGGTGQGSTIAVRAFLRAENVLPSVSGAVLFYLEGEAGSSYVSLSASPTQTTLTVRHPDATRSTPVKAFTFEPGRWYCLSIEVVVKLSGSVRLEIDDVPQLSLAADLGPVSFPAGINFANVGLLDARPTSPLTVYIDDVAFGPSLLKCF